MAAAEKQPNATAVPTNALTRMLKKEEIIFENQHTLPTFKAETVKYMAYNIYK